MLKGEFWKEWEKPWSEEQVKMVYIQAPRKFTVEELCKAAGVSIRTYYNWQETRKENWANLREAYFKKLHTKAQESTIAKSADKLAKDLRTELHYHFESARNYHEVIRIHSYALKLEFLEYYEDFQSGKINLQQFLKKVKSLKGIEMLNFVNALGRAIELERQALAMDYFQNLDKATQFLEGAGYVVLAKDDFDQTVLDAESEVDKKV